MYKEKVSGFNFLKCDNSHDNSKETIIFIHGASINSNFFTNQIDYFCDKYNVYAPDLPGRNENDYQGCNSVKEYADFIINFIEELDISKPHICGISMGGAIVLDILVRDYENIGSGIVINSGARLQVLDMIFDSVAKDFEGFKESMIKFGNSSKRDPSDLLNQMDNFCVSNPSAAMSDFMACMNYDLMDKIAGIKKRVLILSAEEDLSTPVKYGEYLHNNIPGSEFKILKECGHLSPVEKPEEVNKEIEAFLKD
jgi:pimeloyl-ACP methyl ester carboxylesterase